MEEWLTGVMTVLMAVSLAACTPATEKQKKETTAAVATRSQEDMAPPDTDGASDKVPDPNVMSVAVISIYHEGGGSLMQDMDSLDTEDLDAQLLADKLIEYGVLTDGTEVLSFDAKEKDKNAVGTLDLSRTENAEGCSDKMPLTEIGNTFTKNFKLSKLKLRVNDGNRKGDDARQGDSGYLTYNADYKSVEQRSERDGCPTSGSST